MGDFFRKIKKAVDEGRRMFDAVTETNQNNCQVHNNTSSVESADWLSHQKGYTTSTSETTIRISRNSEISANASDEYTELGIFGANIRFKKTNPTYFWDSNNDFGAGEIDTVYLFSEGGVEVDMDLSTMITFQTDGLEPGNEAHARQTLNKWYKMTNVMIERINNSIFLYHIVGETTSIYYECYYMEYDGDMDGDIFHVNYDIALEAHKDEITADQLEHVKEEYHMMIHTLQFV